MEIIWAGFLWYLRGFWFYTEGFEEKKEIVHRRDAEDAKIKNIFLSADPIESEADKKGKKKDNPLRSLRLCGELL